MLIIVNIKTIDLMRMLKMGAYEIDNHQRNLLTGYT